jgi:hypothetical protein
VNEKVGLGMTVANLQKYEIHMLAIRELGPPSKLSHRLLECRASATYERADGDLLLCDGRRNTRIQPDNATMSWMRYLLMERMQAFRESEEAMESRCAGFGRVTMRFTILPSLLP